MIDIQNSVENQKQPQNCIALRARYDHSRSNRLTQVMLEGKADAYRELAHILSSPLQPTGVQLRLLEVKGSASPFDGDFANIGILWGGEAIRVLHLGDTLLLTGGEMSLDVLAENVRYYANRIEQPHAIGTHLHIEYWKGIGYLEPDTPSVILEELREDQVVAEECHQRSDLQRCTLATTE